MRQRFIFWLDHSKPQEKHIAEEIQLLKGAGLFARTVRDGISLICDLRAGRTEVLHELFPWVFEQENSTFSSATDTSHKSTDEKITQQLDRLETLLLTQGAIPIANGSKASQSPIPLQEQHRRPAYQETSDIQLEITHSKESVTNRSAWNFMISSAALQGKYNGLPQEVIEYGLTTGRIPPNAIQPKPIQKESTGPKAMDVPQFETPNFDDSTFDID